MHLLWQFIFCYGWYDILFDVPNHRIGRGRRCGKVRKVNVNDIVVDLIVLILIVDDDDLGLGTLIGLGLHRVVIMIV